MRLSDTPRPGTCPAPRAMQRFLRDQFSGRHGGETEGHVDSCPFCQHTLDRLAESLAPRDEAEAFATRWARLISRPG